MPTHKICNELGMTRNRFRFMWHHFHCNVPTEDDYNKDILGMGKENDTMIQDGIDMERIWIEQEEQNANDYEKHEEEDEMNEEEGGDSSTNDKKWYDKLAPLIDHMRFVSESIIHIIGRTYK